MSILKKVIIAFLILAVISVISLSWYAARHGMDEARSFSVNEKTMKHRLLIATQGSVFKDSVVATVISQLKTLPIYIQVIDVSELQDVNENEWEVIVILHTWEIFEPEEEAAAFMKRITSKNKIIVISTSGSGEEQLQAVDGITSASLLIEVPSVAERTVQRVKSILDLQ